MSTASNRSDRPAASLSQLLVIFLTFIRFTTALQYVSGSSCASLCSTDVAGTLEDDIVCVDEDYQENKKASSFQKCVGCLLNSTAVDTTHNISDVEWGLCKNSRIETRGREISNILCRQPSSYIIDLHVWDSGREGFNK